MPWLASLCLYILHALYSIIFSISSYWQHLLHRDPLPLISLRSRIPTHLAILLTASPECGPEDTENAYIESIKRASAWCREVGVNVLTVYDNDGVLLSCSKNIRECVTVQEGELVDHDESSWSDIEYPLTPPLSDCSESRSISPEDGQEICVISIGTTLNHDARSRRKPRDVMTRRRQSKKDIGTVSTPFCIHIASHAAGKPAVASLARALAQLETLRSHGAVEFRLSVEELGSHLEGTYGFPSPDILIVYSISPSKHRRSPLELHNFPPWQIRLTEIHRSTLLAGRCDGPVPLDEVTFRSALDAYAGAEMRLGR